MVRLLQVHKSSMANTYIFNADGSQVKGGVVKNADGTYSKYNASTGERLTNEFFTTGDNNWYYIGANGKSVTGEVKIGDDTLFLR